MTKQIDDTVIDDDENTCPICCGPMDKTDYRLFPCPCGFQICMWCLNTLEAEKDRCPNCRAPYNRENYRIVGESDDETEAKGEEKGDASRIKSVESPSIMERRNKIYRMHQTRIIQRNLVYVVGMTSEDSNIELLQSKQMFGKYGPILKVVLGNTNLSHPQSSTIGIYLTFENPADALHCIEAIDGFCYKEHVLKASFGTTKYCNSFIKGIDCVNPECLYLHEEAPKEDCFLRDEMTIGDFSFYKATHPGHGSYWDNHQRMFIYHKRSQNRSGTLLPDYREHTKKPAFVFGLDPIEMDQLIPEQVLLYPMITSNTDVFFTSEPDAIVKPSDKKNIGVSIDLNDLFGTASQTKSNRVTDDIKEEQILYTIMNRQGNNRRSNERRREYVRRKY